MSLRPNDWVLTLALALAFFSTFKEKLQPVTLIHSLLQASSAARTPLLGIVPELVLIAAMEMTKYSE